MCYVQLRSNSGGLQLASLVSSASKSEKKLKEKLMTIRNTEKSLRVSEDTARDTGDL